MLGTLWTVYLSLYVILTPFEFAGSLIYIGGMFLPVILFAAWKIFEAMQSGGEFSVYYKVMGRWYFQLWTMMILPCSVMANFGLNWFWIAVATAIIVPTIIWLWMYHWMNTGTMILDKEEYDTYRRVGRDVWTTSHELNWEEQQ